MKLDANDWFTPARFAALLGLLIVVCFPQVILGWESFFLVDYGSFSYPVGLHHRESFRDCAIPLWNPLNNCGVPFLAEWNTLVLYPLSLFYVLFPMPWSFGVFCLGNLFLGGMGMYLLSCHWTHHRLAGAAAGVAFAFNGLTWYGLMWPSIVAGLAWMPWIVLGMEMAWIRGGPWLVPAALAMAMQLLAGAPEAALLTWLVIGVLCVERICQADVSWWRIIGRMLGAGGLAAGLAAAQLLPFLDLLAYTSRSDRFGESSAAGLAAMPLSGWINFLAPRFHCVRGSQGVLYQAGQTWTASYYMGAGIVALGLMAIWMARGRRVWVLAGLTLFSLTTSLGSHGLVYDIVRRLIPPVQFVRFPVKFVMLATFTLPLLAACGLRYLLEVPVESRLRDWRRTQCLVLGLLATMAGITAWAWFYPIDKGEAVAVAENTGARAVFLVLTFGCLAWLRKDSGARWRWMPQIALIAAIWFDVFTHAPNLSPTVPSAVFETDLVRRYFQWDNRLEAGNSRAMQSKDALWRMLGSESADPVLDTQARRLSLCQNFNLLDHVAKIDGSYSLDLKDFFDVFQRLYFTTNECDGLKDFMGVSRISNPTNIVDWIPRESALPLLTAGQKPVYASGADTLNALIDPRFDPLRTVFLPEEARNSIRASRPVAARIISPTFSSHRLGMEVSADAPTIVVAAQAFYHPWRAYVDDKPTRLWRANYAFQAVEVPAGRHSVRLIYDDRSFFWGVVLSSVSLVICGAAGVLGIRNRRRGMQKDPGYKLT